MTLLIELFSSPFDVSCCSCSFLFLNTVNPDHKQSVSVDSAPFVLVSVIVDSVSDEEDDDDNSFFISSYSLCKYRSKEAAEKKADAFCTNR